MEVARRRRRPLRIARHVGATLRGTGGSSSDGVVVGVDDVQPRRCFVRREQRRVTVIRPRGLSIDERLPRHRRVLEQLAIETSPFVDVGIVQIATDGHRAYVVVGDDGAAFVLQVKLFHEDVEVAVGYIDVGCR